MRRVRTARSPPQENESRPPARSSPATLPIWTAFAAPTRVRRATRRMAFRRNVAQGTKRTVRSVRAGLPGESPQELAHKIRRPPFLPAFASPVIATIQNIQGDLLRSTKAAVPNSAARHEFRDVFPAVGGREDKHAGSSARKPLQNFRRADAREARKRNEIFPARGVFGSVLNHNVSIVVRRLCTRRLLPGSQRFTASCACSPSFRPPLIFPARPSPRLLRITQANRIAPSETGDSRPRFPLA